MSDDEQEYFKPTNVYWFVKPEDYCLECGKAVTKNTPDFSYSYASEYKGRIHMKCQGGSNRYNTERFFPPVAKRSDVQPSEFGQRQEMKEADEES